MRETRPSLRTLALVTVSIVIAAIVDLFVYPHRNLTVFVAIPILISALTCPPEVVVAAAVLATGIDLLDIVRAHTSPDIWPYTLSALLLIAGLGILLARERQETARHARQAEAETRAAEAARTRLQQFLGMVSHDLRSPLFAILANLELLQVESAGWGDLSRANLRTIEDAARRMERLVHDLLDAARIGADRFVVTPVPLDLVETVRPIVQQYQAMTKRHAITFDAPERIDGEWDRERIAQVFANLLGNAIAYSPSGGSVRVRLEVEDSGVVASVTDEGTGIPPDQFASLFQPFSRLDSRTQGNGLGLYISQAIVEGHGGRIEVESPPRAVAEGEAPRGTRFIVRLPRKPSASSFATPSHPSDPRIRPRAIRG